MVVRKQKKDEKEIKEKGVKRELEEGKEAVQIKGADKVEEAEEIMTPEAILQQIPSEYQGMAKTYLELPKRVADLEERMDKLLKALDNAFARTEEARSLPRSSEGTPQKGGLESLMPLVSQFLGGSSGDIIPVEMQKQIVANVMANALLPPDRFGDFLKGFDTALKTMTVMTRRKMPKLGLEEIEEVE